jgi:N-acetylglucosamine malate deacetylase 2
MKILYIFPHPDDESYGPAGAMYRQQREGHEVHLLTLTKGGATKERHRLGLSIDEMGKIRAAEMLEIAKVLKLSSLTVWDWPDSELQDVDPRNLERAIADFIRKMQPDILVTYPVHGISGFHDHLVCHAVVKRVFLQLQDEGTNDYLKRLAFYTIKDHDQPTFSPDGFIRMRHSAKERIDCKEILTEEDRAKNREALLCYKSYIPVIEASGILNKLDKKAHFEIYNEKFDPPLTDLTEELGTSN